jgi:hypothetical protein
MAELVELWLPIVLSAVIVFVASSIIWMATPLHKNDYKDPGDKEESLLNAVRSAGLAPGAYYLPWCAGAKAKDPAVQERLKSGPWAMLTVMPGAPNMGRMLGLWFLHLLIVGVFVAYIGVNAGLPPGAPYLSVFRIAGSAALLAYAGYALPMAIWHGMPMSQLPGRLIDGVVYALLTAGTFAAMWPDASPGA